MSVGKIGEIRLWMLLFVQKQWYRILHHITFFDPLDGILGMPEAKRTAKIIEWRQLIHERQ